MKVFAYSIYHSANSYIGIVLLRRAKVATPAMEIVRRPIHVPKDRGVFIAEMLGGRENRNVGAYNREDCARWANRHSIPLSYPAPEVFAERARAWAQSELHREELPARAFFAADPARRDSLDEALFRAAWVEGLDVNAPDTVRWAAREAGLNGDSLLRAAREERAGSEARAALAAFDEAACPGVPTFVVRGQRFFGKDRVDWARETCEA